MKYNEEKYKEEVNRLYNGEIEVVGRFKGLDAPILVKDKYGVIQVSLASLVLHGRPGIKTALNKTEYFMNQLKEKQPEIYKLVKPASEYKKAKEKMLFETKYGLISVNPDSLMSGHVPTVRVAVNRKQYMYNQLRILYDYKYDFKIISTDRHSGKCELICPKHGSVLIDNDYIFEGCGCTECNRGAHKSNVLYVFKLTNQYESFYKLGISYFQDNGKLQRLKQYRTLGYQVEIITQIQFDTFVECAEKELKLKSLIKDNLFQPKIWPNEKSTETFSEDLLNLIIKNL